MNRNYPPSRHLRLAVLTASLFLCGQVLAQSRPIALPAQTLERALNQLARDSGTQILYSSEFAAGKMAPAVSGTMTVREALDRLLAGSGLGLHVEDERTFMVVQARPGISSLAPVTVTAQGDNAPSTAYIAPAVSNATRLALSPRETPQSVSVVTRQRMEDQAMQTLPDALRQATGVKVQEAEVLGTQYQVRGFTLDTIQIDGLPVSVNSADSSASPDLAIYDRVEILRGAAGLLQGAGTPGGTLNLVRKMPTREFTGNAAAQVGSWDAYRVEADVSGPLSQSGDLRGRLVAVEDDRHSFIDYVKEDKQVLYGVLQYDLSPSLQLTAGVDYQRTKGVPQGTGIVFYEDGGDIGLPRSTYLGAAWNHRETRTTRVFGDLSWKLDNGWKAKLSALREWNDNDLVFLSASGGLGVNRATGLGPFLNYANARHIEQTQSSLEVSASGPFTLLGRQHELVLGANTRRNPADGDRVALLGYSSIRPNVRNWNPASVAYPNITPYDSRATTETRQTGVYAATRLSLAEPLTLLLGGRFSWWDYQSTNTNLLTGGVTSRVGYQVDAEFTPYAGLVFDLNRQYSLYASYTDVFQPQNAVDRTGSLLDPIVGANYEAGIKGEFQDGRVNASLAVFRIDQSNRAQNDLQGPRPCPYTTGDYCSVAAGKVRSQGVEAEVSGELAPGWQVFAGYTLNTTKYLNDTTRGGQVFNAFNPRHMLKLFTAYRLPDTLSAWTVGGGLTWQSEYIAQTATSRMAQPGYALANLMLRYDFNRNMSATLNLNNAFDKRYYRYLSQPSAFNYYGEPRNVMLTLRTKF
ncbi:TonB-dependent siderophore receptor [Pigmentiphaga aceris]|uniref:TonB-dependent siderophore receptor n=1 Tax=Pigmentiphaga aceris TaxID=1940612 RepID=A0A5C0B2U4_9BURK|nr:TonB-dependent siderophore receptor [Pigmentiphaga aceris]QEI08585.1 TonB-dependent siderophore receptor [Pigmentiphaga aceris]